MDAIPLWWRPPFIGGVDPLIDAASREFVARHSTYGVGDLLAHLRRRLPAMRAEQAAAKAKAKRRAHAAAVRELCKTAA
jgi:hypothetical protein